MTRHRVRKHKYEDAIHKIEDATMEYCETEVQLSVHDVLRTLRVAAYLLHKMLEDYQA